MTDLVRIEGNTKDLENYLEKHKLIDKAEPSKNCQRKSFLNDLTMKMHSLVLSQNQKSKMLSHLHISIASASSMREESISGDDISSTKRSEPKEEEKKVFIDSTEPPIGRKDTRQGMKDKEFLTKTLLTPKKCSEWTN